jgi:hypothetical protein
MNSIIAPKPVLVNGPKVGDILVGTWGYDACIADFLKVVEVGKKTVKVVMLDGVATHTGPMEWTSMPSPDMERGEVATKKVEPQGNSYRIKGSNCSFYLWSGKPVHCYNYH